MSDILEVEGANGEPVPYAGYVEISVKFPKEFIASEPEVQTLALIVPDVRSNSSVPVLIGTNTLDPLYGEYCDDNTIRSISFGGYTQVQVCDDVLSQKRGSWLISIRMCLCMLVMIHILILKLELECNARPEHIIIKHYTVC